MTPTPITVGTATTNMGEMYMYGAIGGVVLTIIGLMGGKDDLATVGLVLAGASGFMFLKGVSTIH